MSVQVLAEQLKGQDVEPERIHAARASSDYPHWIGRAMESVVREFPGSLRLFTREASPQMNPRCVVEAFKAPRRLGRCFNATGSFASLIFGIRHRAPQWRSAF